MDFPRNNNFDLIRLMAAAQVLFVHIIENLNLSVSEWFLKFLYAFSGVPIFFVVSGFLISASYQRRKSLLQYSTNRALRIFPALWVCFLLSATTAWLLGGFEESTTAGELAKWVLAQISIVQFYNPDFLRGYGVGALNAALWTISVELQFYIVTPIAIYIYYKQRTIFWIGFGAFLLLNVGNTMGVYANNFPDIVYKLIKVSLFPWFVMFLIGAIIQINYAKLRVILEGKALIWIIAYLLAVAANFVFDMGIFKNTIAAPWAILLALATISCAFTANNLAEKLLRGNDVSYGLYIYHLPVINALLSLGFVGVWSAGAATVALSIALACMSWLFVEKPTLALKGFSLKRGSNQGNRA